VFARLGEAVSAASLFALMLLTFVDVVGRNAFKFPFPGGTELTELLMAALVFAVLPILCRNNGHVVIDLLDPFIPARWQPVQLLFANLLGAVTFAVISWRVWVEGGKTAAYGGMTPYLEWPMAPFLYAMAIMAGVAAAAFLAAAMAYRTQPR